MKTSLTKLLSLLLVLVTLLIPVLTACGGKGDTPSDGKCTGEHIYDSSCDATCNACGDVREVGEHAYSNACDTECNECGTTREVGEHAYSNACDTECNECGTTREVSEHVDADENGYCDICGAEVEREGFDLPEIPAITVPAFDISVVPEFDNSVEYIALNGNVPHFAANQLVTESYAYYSELDSLGRSGVAVACLGSELFPDSGRGSLPDPTGWHSGSIYERSHLIAHSLAGFDDAKNLITGTYDLNGVMQTFEEMVKAYIVETDNHVMYRVTPVFLDNNLVASGVIMEAWSVEDEGEGICFNVYIYNEQDDEIIDHATGDVTLPEINYSFVANKGNWKIHTASCSNVAGMKDENKFFWEGTYDELVAYLTGEGKSYSNGGCCHPENAE